MLWNIPYSGSNLCIVSFLSYSFPLSLFLFLGIFSPFSFIVFLFVPSLIIPLPILYHISSFLHLQSFITTVSHAIPTFAFPKTLFPILSPAASRTTRNMNGISSISEFEQEELLLKLEVFKIKGKDKHGRKILRIIGKFFPARFVSVDVVRKYLEERIFPKLEKRKFSVVYVHSGVDRGENFPGISALRSIYEAIPMTVKENLEAVYFIHPGLQSRLFLATFGRFLFTAGLYGKLRYVSRLDYLWEHVKRNEVELPEFVYDHDEDLEYRPFMDYGLESDHRASASLDSPLSTYSMRCIS